MIERANGASTVDSVGSLEQWRNVVVQKICAVEVTAGSAFPASLSTRPFASGALMRLDVPPHLCTRTSADIAQDRGNDVALVYVLSGEAEYRQFGREAVMRSNDCFTMDFGSPFELLNFAQTQNLTITMPRSWVSRHLRPEEVSGCRIDGDSCWGAALSAYLRAIYMDFDRDSPLSPVIMGEHALQLVELAFGGEYVAGSTHQRGLLSRIRSHMREVYHEEDLTPAKVAAMANLSKAYMHRLFAREGTTFCAELDALRINQAAALLESKGQQHLTINEVGIRSGLPDAPHFARKFRALKGVTPSQYRQLRLAVRH